jgi:hypothetical protein
LIFQERLWSGAPASGVKAEPSAGRLNGEAGVVGGQVNLAQESVGCLDVGYVGEPELLDDPAASRTLAPNGLSPGEKKPR